MLLNHPGKAVFAELVGTAVLVMTVVGSGIAAQRLTDDTGVELLVNALATVAALGVLIALLLPLSGAHLNPVVTLVLALHRRVRPKLAIAYVVAQLFGGIAGTLLAHGMYERAAVSAYQSDRGGLGTALGEVIATAGLVLVVLLAERAVLVWAVPAWIGAAYFFTSSTSFANPAVTIGRAFTSTFAGIRWIDVPGFIAAQVVGGLLAMLLAASLTAKEPT